MGCGNAGGAGIAVGLYVHLVHFNADFYDLFAITKIAAIHLNTGAMSGFSYAASEDQTFQFCTSTYLRWLNAAPR